VLFLAVSTSQRIHREGLALAAVSLFLFVCAFLLSVGLVLTGYTLVDVIAWLVRATGG
jgi:hypothetical protein